MLIQPLGYGLALSLVHKNPQNKTKQNNNSNTVIKMNRYMFINQSDPRRDIARTSARMTQLHPLLDGARCETWRLSLSPSPSPPPPSHTHTLFLKGGGGEGDSTVTLRPLEDNVSEQLAWTSDKANEATIFSILLAMMVMMMMMMMMMMMLMMTLKGAIRDFHSLLTAPRTVPNTYAQVARKQSCANHVNHTGRLSRALCRQLQKVFLYLDRCSRCSPRSAFLSNKNSPRHSSGW